MRVVDRFGEEFDVGDIVTYPVRRGSDLYMVDAVVEAINDEGDCFLIVTPLANTFKDLKPRQVRVDRLIRVTKLPHVNEIDLSPHMYD